MDDDYRDLAPSQDISRLLEIMDRLRDPETGCEWDIQQTFESIVPYTIEEAYEIKDAIERNDMADLCDELGDLLLQVAYHAKIASESGAFDFGNVVEAITRKMIRRHPHVFGTDAQKKSGLKAGEWARIKAAEKAARPHKKEAPLRHLDGISKALPALTLAMRLQKRASQVGFDWNNTDLVFDKLREEFAEFESACARHGDHSSIAEELGDILFVAVNLARHLGIDAEAALHKTNDKFINRFNYIEDSLKKSNTKLSDADLETMERYWQEAKSVLK
ncbi:MAG: nucleoside triphosphate pyrophosphohydrolase [Rhizobiales bacterium]|nr:nucleoside triphosphate pyrophosphohydrolase [Hyphomicrobiales bacterium]